MRRQEFLEALDKIGYPIKESKLRRYTEYGLIRPRKTSGGKSGGVRAEYSCDMLEAIITVEQFQCNPYIEHDREFIFVLFAKGYSVNYGVLKEYFITHFFELVVSIQDMAKGYKNDSATFLAWITFPTILKGLPKLKPGRPSNETLLQRENEKQQEMARVKIGYLLLFKFSNGEMLTVDDILQVANEIGVHNADPDDFAIFLEIFRRDLWEKIICSSTEDDFLEIQRIFNLANRFVEMFMEINPESIPILGSCIAKSREYLDGLRFLEVPRLVKTSIVLLLLPNWRKKTIDLLSDNGNLQLWYDWIREFKQILTDTKGGDER